MNNMPYSEDSEIAIISNVLAGGANVMDELSTLQDFHFWNRTHSMVFKTAQALHLKGLPVDLITISDDLKQKGHLEILHEARLEKLLTKLSFGPAYLEDYSKIIRDRYKLRRLLEVMAEYEPKITNAENSSEVISGIESEIFKINSDDAGNENQLANGVEEVRKQIEARKAGSGAIYGLESGIKTFDDVHGGFKNGLYYVLAGYPSAGKTAFASQILLHILLELKKPCLFISIEMDATRVVNRMACMKAKSNFSRFDKGHATTEELARISQAVDLIEQSPLILKTPTDITGSEIRSEIRKAKRKHDVELCVIDFIQKVTIPHGEDPKTAIGEASQQIQKAGKETGVPCLVLCQLNRASQKEPRPRMHHLAESTQIERDADCVDILWPEKDPNTLEPGEMLPVCLTIEKNKEGARGDEHLYFDGAVLTFKEKL